MLGSTKMLFSNDCPISEDVSEVGESLTLSVDLDFSCVPDMFVLDPELDEFDEELELDELDELDVVEVEDFDVVLPLLELELLRSVEDLLELMSDDLCLLSFVTGDM